MRRRWHLRREAMERPDARQRWDQAYQAILQWSLENEQARAPRAKEEEEEEEYHEGGGIRPGLDLQAGQTRDD
jgi:hypothetical protein